MKDLKTITERQLLDYSRKELLRRLTIIKDELKRGVSRKPFEYVERDIKKYTEQLTEIDNRILERTGFAHSNTTQEKELHNGTKS